MRKIFFALAFFGILVTQTFTYANTLLLTSQEAEMQDEAVSDSTQVDEAVTFDEVPEESESEAPPAEASFTQELKKRFIEGGPGFMGIVLICLILGLAIAIERIIYLNLATTNTQKLTTGVEEAISSGGLTLPRSFVEILKDLWPLFFTRVLTVQMRVLKVLKKQLLHMVVFKWDN